MPIPFASVAVELREPAAWFAPSRRYRAPEGQGANTRFHASGYGPLDRSGHLDHG